MAATPRFVTNARSSCDLDTKAMKASVSVQARGSDTQIFAAAFADGNVALDCGDTFSATFGGQRVVLERAPNPDRGPVLPAPFAVRDLSTNVKVSAGDNVRFHIEPPLKVDTLT